MTIKPTTGEVVRTLLKADGVAPKLIDAAMTIVESDGFIPMVAATRALGVNRVTIHVWCKKYGIPKITRIGCGGSLVYFPGVQAAYEKSRCMSRHAEKAEQA